MSNLYHLSLLVLIGWFTAFFNLDHVRADESATVDESSRVDPATQLGRLYFDASAHGSIDLPIHLHGRDARWQLLVTWQQSEDVRDVTREVEYTVEPAIAEVDARGYLRPLKDGTAQVIARLDDVEATLELEVSGQEELIPVNFPNQVIPIFTKFGCNGGGCHGKAAGQAGFRLSLLGFHPQEDYEHLVIESRGRRIFPAAPSKSLLLQKATGEAPHGGGQRLDRDSLEYRILKRWIASGIPYGAPDDPVVEEINIVPEQRRLPREQSQQLTVLARYSDGSVEDITHTAQFESNNKDLAQVDDSGLVQLGNQSGDVAVMARYQGNVSVFRASIPLGAEIAEWPTRENFIDELVFAKLKTLGIPPSPICDDSTYIRRVTLDLCGRLPTTRETLEFLESGEPDKRQTLVARLLESVDHANYFAKKWSSILRNRRKSPGHQFGSFAFYEWLRDSFHQNKPYDQFVRELLTASGDVETNPPVAWLREVGDMESRTEDAAQLFLGQRIQCARCHHHPFEKWSQQDYYQLAAFFSKVTTKEGRTPEEPIFVSRVGGAGARHPNTGETLPPAGLDATPAQLQPFADPREALVDWMVAPDNPFFARSLANRYWKHFFATGLVEPEDDMRVTNPASNPELLDGLARYLTDSGFDLRQLLTAICTSSSYQLGSMANEHNLGDNNSYSRFYPKRLTAEVLLDAVDQVTQTQTDFAGVPLGMPAVRLPDTGFESYFLDVFGRPEGTTACECERAQEATLAQSLHLLNSKEVLGKLSANGSLPAGMAASSEPLKVRVESLYLTALSRRPTDEELRTASQYVEARKENPRAAFEDLVWAILNSKEFLFNH